MNAARKPYLSDVSDGEWEFLVPYLTLMAEDAPQREHDLREVFNALRYVVKTGCQWRMLPHDLPRWDAVYQQARRWEQAKVVEEIARELRIVLRLAEGRNEHPTAAVFDARTLQSTPESGGRGGFDGHKKKNGSKVHVAVDTLGHLLALKVTPADEQERDQAAGLAKQVQRATDYRVELAFVDQGYTGDAPAKDAAARCITLEVVKHHEAKRGFVLLPRRWVVERTFAWLARFRRLARDYERLGKTLEAWHWVAAVALLLGRAAFQSA